MMIEQTLAGRLRGTADLLFEPEGVTCAIRAPLAGQP
jgi:hypothetical protein